MFTRATSRKSKNKKTKKPKKQEPVGQTTCLAGTTTGMAEVFSLSSIMSTCKQKGDRKEKIHHNTLSKHHNKAEPFRDTRTESDTHTHAQTDTRTDRHAHIHTDTDKEGMKGQRGACTKGHGAREN